MKKIKKSTGITLIALIITVIVMIILVGVTVNVALNGGLFDTAKQAASGMEMAQIRERAEVVKANLFAEAQSNNNVILSKTEFKNRLLQEFEGSTSEGSKVIVEDGKYDIIIKNTDLDIEVVEHSDNQYNTEPSSLVGLDYTTSNIETDGDLCAIKVSINLTKLMDLTQYAELRAKQDAPNGEITGEIKEQIVIEYFSEMYGEQFNSLDEVVVYDINAWYAKNYTTIEECLQDETVQSEWGTTKEQLYYSWCSWIIPTEGDEYTKEEAIDILYPDAITNKYSADFSKYTRNLSVYVENNGKQELVKNSVNITSAKLTVDYGLGKNGKYEFIVKTNNGEEITREIMQINNIISPNPYVLTEDEAEGIWETDGKGTITKYAGQDAEVTVPILIGTEYITEIGDKAFYSNVNITNVKMSDEITSLGISAFSSCKNLENIKLSRNITVIQEYTFYFCMSIDNITLPENLTEIGQGAFYMCIKLSNIDIPEKVNKIGSSAFNSCRNLMKITIKDNVSSIGSYAFQGCTSLENVSIPKSVKTLEGSFSGCTSLKSITFEGEELIYIYNSTFKNCSSLESITIPNSVTTMTTGLYAIFAGCTNLTNIYFAPGDNPIPDGQPWGAPNENLVVTKLTEQ